jgi:outer membrane immunogenic protein
MRLWLMALLSAFAGFAAMPLASAADMPVKAYAPAKVAVQAYNWSGAYIGGNIGYGWGKANTNFDADPVTVDTNLGPVNIPGFAGSQSVKPKGVIGGAQIGYNWQLSPNWVAGLEADIQGADQRASTGFTTAFNFINPTAPALAVVGTAVTGYDAKIAWFGTVRGRIGYAWDRIMLYATGGLAYGEVELNGTRTVSGTVAGLPFSIAHALGHSEVNLGWTVGAGLEGALGNNWTWKAEYLYLDLASLDDPDLAVIKINSVSGGQTFTHTKFTDNILRIGLNYRFGGQY